LEWPSERRLEGWRSASSSDQGFLALHHFIYLTLLFFVFRFWLFGRKDLMPRAVVLDVKVVG
jgi:hypothetical protein